MTDTDGYMIWSHEHRMWWRPDRQGYTGVVAEAGTYTPEEAIDIAGNGIPWGIEVPVPVLAARRHGTGYVYNAKPWGSTDD